MDMATDARSAARSQFDGRCLAAGGPERRASHNEENTVVNAERWSLGRNRLNTRLGFAVHLLLVICASILLAHFLVGIALSLMFDSMGW
jgi:hypothetical protein